MALSDQIKIWKAQAENFDINEVSLENIGTLPLVVKIIVWIITAALIVFAGYTYDISPLQESREKAIKQEAELKKEFETKAFQAANLEEYRQQMIDMNESFGALISQLPTDTEVPGLLEDITNKGVSSGLAFSTIDLLPEVVREFFIELPIKIIADGTYHDMGAFVSGVASLPRIVTLTDFSLKPISAKDSSSLKLEITASTYRYKSDAEEKKGIKDKKKDTQKGQKK